ncbi:uncharacterized protein [Arachis hypogaea]|uniref:uncharacterized protein n=1 Tax=Arachis hypogaea TaxID=3818 RepID=UPI003B2151D7
MEVVIGKQGNVISPKVIFTKEAKDMLSAPYMDAIVIKVLGKHFSYTTLVHKLKGVWKLRGGYKVLDVRSQHLVLSRKRNVEICLCRWKPNKVDMATKSVKRKKYARACIQVDLGLLVVRRVIIDDYEYNVKYECLQLIRDKCSCFSHISTECNMAFHGIETETAEEKGCSKNIVTNQVGQEPVN